ncbi:MAG: tetratricopeptide repeat protein [Chlamydiales bacterium]|nr:tetratricopeptide repeat protein [Chlamydiales bacterium]
MRWYHISFISVLFLCSSFFWEDDEKEIKALQQMAEAAMRDQDFVSAKEAYTTLIKRVRVSEGKKNVVDWQTYIDIVLRFAEACASLDQCDEGVKALSDLLLKNPPQTFVPRITLFRARLTSQKSEPEKAFLDMQTIIESVPEHDWSPEELSFYHALSYSLDANYDDMLRKAKRLTATGFHEEAIQIYEEVLRSIELGHYPKARYNTMLEKKLRYLLVQANYALKEYARSLSFVSSNLDPQNELDQEMLYLMALCYKEKKEFEQALACFENYAESGGEHYDQALFEIGYHYYRLGNIQKARPYFEKLQTPKGKKPKPTIVAATYLARILIDEERYSDVQQLLSPLLNRLPQTDSLRCELHYLIGEAAYALENYQGAAQHYEQAVPVRGRGAWRLQALYKLGWSHLKLENFAKAEGLFLRLLPTSEEESATLALGRLYIAQGKDNVQERLADLFSGKTFSLGAEHEALLLRAEVAAKYLEREALYEEACADHYARCATYAKAWYQRGVNHFQQGLQDTGSGESAFELATAAFEQAFFHYKDVDPKAAARILKLEAKADFYRNSPSTSLAYLEELLEQYSEESEEKEEALYLRGIIASSLNDNALARDCLTQVTTLFPDGRYAADALFWLASLEFQEERYGEAEKTFLILAQNYPDSSFAGDGWYWAALASEKLGGEKSRIFRLRRQVYERYPSSQFAAEAYFHQYAYADYLEGKEEALSHLMPFPQMFPKSPLVVAVHYLMGVHAHSYEKGVWRFKEAIRSFHSCSTFDPTAISFLYQARLDLALLHMKHDIPRGKTVLEIMLEEFASPHHPLVSKLPEKNTLFERAQFAYGESLLSLGQKGRAQECFEKLLEHFDALGVTEGLYPSLTWCETAKLAMECEDFTTALACFEIAEECGQHYLSSEQTLDLLINKSACYRGQKEYDQAMRLLSKAINADIASPLRLKAMLLRADLYELQERPELAYRQLESVARMGGEWGEKAKQKLRTNYGLD